MDEAEVVRNSIWENIPELHDTLVAFERKSVENDLEDGIEPFISPYTLISVVFTQSYFFPLLDDLNNHDEKLQECANAIEQMLKTPSESLNGAVGIRIVEHLLLPPERWRRFREYAGPLLKAEVLKSSEFFPWPYDEPVV